MMERKTDGFTLMEILVTMTLVSIIATGAISNTYYTKRVSAGMQQKLTALQVIDKEFAEIKKTDAKDTVNATVGVAELKNGYMRRVVTTAYAGPGGTPDPNFKQIQLTVGWDLPWRTRTGRCDSVGCDKEETAVSAFYYSGG